MRFSKAYPGSFIAVVTLILIGTMAAEPEASSSPVDVSAVAGAAAVRVSGTAAGQQKLQAVLYAAFAPELPIVLLARKPLAIDAGGHFGATISIAPAYYVGTVVTVIVQTLSGVVVGRGSIRISDPPDAAPVHT